MLKSQIYETPGELSATIVYDINNPQYKTILRAHKYSDSVIFWREEISPDSIDARPFERSKLICNNEILDFLKSSCEKILREKRT